MKSYIANLKSPRKRFLWAAATALVLGGLFATPAHAAKLTVNCPEDSSTSSSINAAILAAAPGDTIIVCPGFYFEHVVVNKDHLKIESERAGAAKIRPGGGNGPGFQLNASYVKIEGFEVALFFLSSDAGIYVGDGFGHESLEKNILSFNFDGISFHNSLYNEVEENLIQYNVDNGVLDFVGSVVVGNDEANEYSGNHIRYNGVEGGHGIFINTAAPCAYTRARIVKNESENNGGDGVFLNNSDHVVVDGNELSFNGSDGIELIGSNNNLISSNHLNQNGFSIAQCGPSEGSGNCTGIRLHSNSTNNKISHNTAKDNLVWDAQDNSSGFGTAGTANTWTKDVCPKDSPEGICE
jgi:parallel beta-helix repeat protein